MLIFYLLALTKPLVTARIHGFREALRVQPGDAVAHLEPGILDRDGETVPGAGPAEREHVPAGLEHPQAFGRPELAPLLKRL